MNGPAAFPTQYPISMMALTVTFLVCPAVTLVNHDSASTNAVTLMSAQSKGEHSFGDISKKRPTSKLLPAQQPRLITPRK